MDVRVSRWGEQSAEQDKLFSGLVKFGGMVGAIPRNNQGEFGAFSDLDAVLSVISRPMCECGLRHYQAVHDVGEGFICLETTILHSSGQYRTSYKYVYTNGQDDADQGGSTGYWSRICLMKALGLRSESLGKVTADDDDGQKGRGVFDAGLLKGKEKEWFSKAEKALSAPGADRGEVLTKIYDSVAKGKMSQEMMDDLRKRFPVDGGDK
jgi:hypothetical protein